MLQWKQRLYAFLLRRILGPLLDAESLTKLHQTIEISLQEGRFALTDVSLNTVYLANLLADKFPTFRIRKARIRRLEIHLTLQDHSLHEGEVPSSLAWRAMKLGSTAATAGSPAVSLLAQVEIDGVVIEIEPNPFGAEPLVDPAPLNTDGTEQLSSSRSILSSYVDAALASLLLTLKMENLQVRFCSGSGDDLTSNESWLEYKFKSVSYHDMEVTSSGDEASDYETVMQKAVDINRVTILVGETAGSDEGQVREKATALTSTIALMEGSSRVCLRAIEYKTSKRSESPDNSDFRQLQHDVEVNLDQRLNLSVDEASLLQIQKIVQGFQDVSRSPPELRGERLGIELGRQDGSVDKADLSTIDGIMKQYQEARLYAERNEIRGGILLPTTDEEDGGAGGVVTFDAFFDANDQSFYRYSTVLRESVLLVDGDRADHDFVHTKIRFHLKGGGIKVSFRANPVGSVSSTVEATSSRRPDDYMLLTFNDLNLSSSLSLRESDFELSVANLDIEDSQADQSYGQGQTGSVGRRAEIGSVLQFSPSRSGASALDDSDILLEAPCISFHVKVENEGEYRTSDVELTLEPFELTYRQATMSNISQLFKSTRASDDLKQAELVGKSQAPAGNTVKLHAFCDSISVTIPLPREKDWGSLYERCGYDGGGSMTTRSSLGIFFDQVTVEMNVEDSPEESTSLSCHHALVFASSPCGKHALERKLQHFDILAMSGLTDVHPVIPVSVKLYRSNKEGGNGVSNRGTVCFPVVPTISSFKARQEDEDEDNRIDRVLSSNLNDLETDVRKGLRANDPQSAMISEASESDRVIDIRIPETTGDLSSNELVALSDMLECIRESSSPASNTSRSSAEQPASSDPMGLSLNCDYVSLAVHGSLPQSAEDLDGCKSPSSFSYMTKFDRLKTHTLLEGSGIRHMRVLSHEVDFFEISDLSIKPVHPLDSLCSSRARRDALRDRSTRNPNSSVTPLLHRSHLFSPISRQSPSFLLDIINVSFEETEDMKQRNIHLTLYDTTYRYDFDSGWMNRFRSIFIGPAKVGDNDDVQAESCSAKTLTRVFLSVADCNVDYSSSPRFNTPSRTIVRVGDLRLSSNLVLPLAPVQAFSFSLGDAAVYLCPLRYPYNFENSRLLQSTSLMKPEDASPGRPGWSSRPAPTAESVLREMNYRAILMLDSMDAIFAVSTLKPSISSDPYVCASITVGELSLFGCKDSFARFVKTVGELQGEMSALDDEAFTSLRAMSKEGYSATGISMDSGSGKGNETDEIESGHPTFFALDDLKRQSALRPSAGTSTKTDRGKQFLLDGYDWTAIDLDESNESGIPPGEEQASGWYGTNDIVEESNAECEEIGFLPGHGLSETEGPKPRNRFTPSIITHHFPLQPVSDPLGDGDMGATKYAGTESPPQVQNRVTIHDLAIKLRFFDGYDWPELLNETKRSAARKGAFVIDEEPARIAEMKADSTQEVKTALGDSKMKKLERRAELMGNLLASAPDTDNTFQDLPLPEERGRLLKEQADVRRLARRTGKYFQVYASGVSLRLDSHRESSEHKLVSCMNLAAQDFFLAETISSDRPVKMIGEWLNEVDHPRESRDGLLMMKMVTWHPSTRMTPENKIANDECETALKMLPLRCILDQRAIRFILAFFRGDSDTDGGSHTGLPPGLHAVPSPLFLKFHVDPVKLKIDYTPQFVDRKALRDGAIVELINLSPLDAMVLTLEVVEVENVVGFSDALGIVIGRWISHICQTQLLKFLTNTRAFEPLMNVGGGVADMVILPWDAFQNGESIKKALRSGVSSFTKAVTYEALTTTSRLAHFVAGGVAEGLSMGAGLSGLPSRPLGTPRTILDTTPHVVESLARGLQTANYTVVIIPYREYHRSGTTGAIKSVLKGIPVALAAPASGAVEALSFALLGARNQIRPDIRKEEEASQKGLHFEG